MSNEWTREEWKHLCEHSQLLKLRLIHLRLIAIIRWGLRKKLRPITRFLMRGSQ